ncbi:MAG: outer membrane protein assembly factor BamA [Phycisphaeraceae bacterium]|nr:outer membrane protein assembly factor BamA [Phycisphaeraceae bacterium]
MVDHAGNGVSCRIGLVVLLALLAVCPLSAQTVDYTGRPITDIKVEGLKDVPESLVRNQIRVTRGEPYDPKTVQNDVSRITHLGRFMTVEAKVETLADGTVVLTYVVQEQPQIADVRVVGNKAINDQDLLRDVVIQKGDPIDSFLIDRGVQSVKRAYEAKGYFDTEVVIDKQLLDESHVVLYRVREGPKVRTRAIRFEGNQVFSDDELYSQIKTRTYIFLLRSGEMSRTVLEDDADKLRAYYRDRGYLDAEVGRRIDLSPDQKDATVVFFIEEGRQYVVDSIRVEGNVVFSAEQIIETLPLRVGGIFSTKAQTKSQEAAIDLYGKLGYIETKITIDRLFHEHEPRVDLVVRIEEGSPYLVGKVAVRGNEITKDKVILRQVRGMTPNHRFDRAGIDQTQKRLKESALFEDAKVTVLDNEENDEHRDVLVEVKEKNTGSLSFGAGVSSDAGVIGAIELTQRNFDITDVPESFGEFFTGKAFRGAGQYFALTLQPGNEVSTYSVNFREPYLFDSQYFLDTSAFFFQRDRDDYDEQRIGGNFGIGQRFGDVWSAKVVTRVEQVTIDDIGAGAATDIAAVEGDSLLTSLGPVITRNTTDSRILPSVGSITTLGVHRIGALGGDYDFTKASINFKKFWTVDEDFLGRRTIFSIDLETGYIFEEDSAPIFERFYAGGHRSLRGFQYRGIGPRGLNTAGQTTDDSIGGEWLFLASAEYNIPIFEEIIRWVFFVDSGTLSRDVSLDNYRVSVGTGLRLTIPGFNQAPFAFDVAFPVRKFHGDEERIFSFDVALPF